MATFTTKAFCPTLSLSPSHCLSVSLSHISTQLHTCAVSVSFASTNSLSRTPSPSLSVSGCVSLSAKPIFYSVSLALSHLSFCSDSSVFICVSSTTPLFLNLPRSDFFHVSLSHYSTSQALFSCAYSTLPSFSSPPSFSSFALSYLSLLLLPLFFFVSRSLPLPTGVQQGHWNPQPNKDSLRKMPSGFQQAV